MLNPAAAVAAAAAARHNVPGGGPPGQPGFKLNIVESIERIKEEFNFLQAQYHNLKLDCEKLVQEKTEMQRHYVMYYEMSYGLNVEMHKQMEIAKRLNAIIAQLLPFLSQEHQQQVVTAVERAKQVSMSELNAIIGQQQRPDLSRLMQLQAAGAGLPSSLTGLPPGLLGGAGGAGGGPPPGSLPGMLQHAAAAGLPAVSVASLMGGLPGQAQAAAAQAASSAAAAAAATAAHLAAMRPDYRREGMAAAAAAAAADAEAAKMALGPSSEERHAAAREQFVTPQAASASAAAA